MGVGTTSVFSAGSELVWWELRALGVRGPYRLAVRHSTGQIVEYFKSTGAALVRQSELAELLRAARGCSEALPVPALAATRG